MAILASNKEGRFNYEILETYQAGIALAGAEVKSVKSGRVTLKGAYVTVDKNNEVWLINAQIPPYLPAQNTQSRYDPSRPRKLLLHKKEIDSLAGKSRQKGLTIIPLLVYTKKGLIKVDVGLAKGKTTIDKRESIKKRETQREINRTLKRRK